MCHYLSGPIVTDKLWQEIFKKKYPGLILFPVSVHIFVNIPTIFMAFTSDTFTILVLEGIASDPWKFVSKITKKFGFAQIETNSIFQFFARNSNSISVFQKKMVIKSLKCMEIAWP